MLFKDTPIYKPLLDICENFERPVESEMIDVNQLKFKNSELKENEWFETRIVMAERKVDFLQGYYFARPLPPEEFAAYLMEHNRAVKQA